MPAPPSAVPELKRVLAGNSESLCLSLEAGNKGNGARLIQKPCQNDVNEDGLHADFFIAYPVQRPGESCTCLHCPVPKSVIKLLKVRIDADVAYE